MSRSISSSGSVFKAVLLAFPVFFGAGAEASLRVKVEDFTIKGTPGIIISPSDLTKLLWRTIGFQRPYELNIGQDEMPLDSFGLRVSGDCEIIGENYFKLDWKVERIDRQFGKTFTYEGEDLKTVRNALFGSIDSMIAPLSIITDPDSSGIIVDGIYMGESPLSLEAFPRGWHTIKAKSPIGLEVADSFCLTSDTTFFRYVLVEEDTFQFAFVHLVTPPLCELYLDGVRKSPLNGSIYRFDPGEVKFNLVSPQYGTREIKLNLIPGDTVEIGFFNHKQ